MMTRILAKGYLCRRRKAAGVFLFLTKRNLSYIAGYDIIFIS